MNSPICLLRHRLSVTDIGALKQIKVLLFDCDGVIWKGTQPIIGAVETINFLKHIGKDIYYVTNNSTKSRKDTLKKLQDMGINSSLDEVITSSYATANYLKTCENVGDVYVVGEDGIFDELESVGIRSFGREDNGIKDINSLSIMNHEIGTVVVGLDRNVNYIKLSRAAAYIRDHHCRFIATNTDASFPNAGGILSGGSGCLVSAVETICGKKPDMIIGKPSSAFIDIVLSQRSDINLDNIMMVGDRLDTDILFARLNNVKSLCVLSGIASEKSILDSEDDVAPHLYTDSLFDIFRLMNDDVNASCEDRQI